MTNESDSPNLIAEAGTPQPKSSSGVIARVPLLADAADEPEKVHRPLARGTPAYRPPNVRRSSHTWRLFGALLMVMLLVVAGLGLFGYSFYLSEIKPAITLIQANAARQVPLVSPADGTTAARAVEIEIPAALRQEIASSSSKIEELQRQFDGVRALLVQMERRYEKLAEGRGASTSTDAASLAPPASPGSVAAAAQPTLTPVTEGSAGLNELRLMKERNRLTGYADEAISTGDRRSLEQIVEAMRDPGRSTLYHAAKAEYYRVMGHYQFVTRIDPGYKLPVPELFAEEGLRNEADLTTTQLIDLLQDKEMDWQVRLRSAFLLGGRNTSDVGEALIAALKKDPNLDVAKEAQLSFEQNMGRRFLLFDIATAESWWQTQAALRSDSAASQDNPEAKPSAN